MNEKVTSKSNDILPTIQNMYLVRRRFKKIYSCLQKVLLNMVSSVNARCNFLSAVTFLKSGERIALFSIFFCLNGNEMFLKNCKSTDPSILLSDVVKSYFQSNA